MPSLRKIGAAFVDLVVRKDTLRQDLDQAKREVEQTADQMDRAGRKAGDGFRTIGDGIERTTEPARRLVGSLTAAAGIVTGISATVGVLVASSVALVARWVEFVSTVRVADAEAGRLAEKTRDIVEQLRLIRGEGGPFESKEIRQARQDIADVSEELRIANEALIEAQLGSTALSFNLKLVGDIANQFNASKYQQFADDVARLSSDLENARGNLARIQEIEESREGQEASKARAEALAQETAELQKQADLFDSLRRKQKVFYFERQQAAEEAAENARKEHAERMKNIADEHTAQLKAIQEMKDAYRDALREMSKGLGLNDGLRRLADLPYILDSLNSKSGTGY